jgi:hypothetical protein
MMQEIAYFIMPRHALCILVMSRMSCHVHFVPSFKPQLRFAVFFCFLFSPALFQVVSNVVLSQGLRRWVVEDGRRLSALRVGHP